MPEDARIWKILKNDELKEIKKSKLDLEERIENWLERDISILSDDLLVIGRQVDTGICGTIDLLCLDTNGDVVIVELKRDKTPREVTAQALDYASWIKDLSNDKITEIADKYLAGKEPLDEAFKIKFGEELPETINGEHSMLIVGSEIDARSERIINYLSDTYGVGINAATFQYFRDENNRELLARVFLIEPSEVEYKTQTKTSSKRKPNLTYEQLEEIAEKNGVGDLYRYFVDSLTPLFDKTSTRRSSIAFVGLLDGSKKAIMNLIPQDSNQNKGLYFQVYIPRLSDYFNVDKNHLIALLPKQSEEWKYYYNAPPDMSGYAGFFKNKAEIQQFVKGLSKSIKE